MKNGPTKEVFLKGKAQYDSSPSSDKLLFKLKILFALFTKQGTLKRRTIALSLPPHLAFPGPTMSHHRNEQQNLGRNTRR
jgi:hypothetical protein